MTEADAPLTCVIDKPTRLGELFEADFLLRRCFFVWGADSAGRGRLQVKTWAQPDSAYAAYTLTEAYKATPQGTQDAGFSSQHEDDDFYNIVKVEYDLRIDGSYGSTLNIIDAASVRDHGARPFTIKARNTFGQGSGFSPIDSLVASFSGLFTMTSKPWLVLKRSIDLNRFESTIPGTVLSVTDRYIRNPATGLRYNHQTGTGGLSGYPGMVIGHKFDWGCAEIGRDGGAATIRAPAGEVEIMLVPSRTQGTYCPTAQVDESAANAGYNAGTKTLTTYAHKFTESSESNDNTYFGAGDKVYIYEIDHQTAAGLSWSDEVATVGTNTIVLTTGLAGWDNTKRYRVTYDAYSTVTSTQKAKVYQADDADGLVADTVQAYGLGFFGSSQSTQATVSDGTELPVRHRTTAYGDGRPLDNAYDRDAAVLCNNLIQYKYARQQPTVVASSEIRDGNTTAGDWLAVEIYPIFLGVGVPTAGRTRSLFVAPRFRSKVGTAYCRVSLCRRPPTGSSLTNVTRTAPYVEHTFDTASSSFVIPTAEALDITHCKLEDGLLGAVGFLLVEMSTSTVGLGSNTDYAGLAVCRQGPWT